MKLNDASIGTEIKKIVSYYRGLYPKNANEIEDIVQTCLFKAVRLGHTEICPTYLKKSVNNLLIDLNSLSRVRREHVSLEDCEGFSTHNSNRELRFDARRAMEESNISGPNVLQLYFVDGLTCEEIAKALNITKDGAVKRVNRQLARAKKLLGDYENNNLN